MQLIFKLLQSKFVQKNKDPNKKIFWVKMKPNMKQMLLKLQLILW